LSAHLAAFRNSSRRSGDVGEGEWAAVGGGACYEVVAACVQGDDQSVPDDLKIIDASVDLCNFGGRMSLQADINVTVTVASGLQKIGHLMQAEAEPLRRLDHP
jgi:hypothetical protein